MKNLANFNKNKDIKQKVPAKIVQRRQTLPADTIANNCSDHDSDDDIDVMEEKKDKPCNKQKVTFNVPGTSYSTPGRISQRRQTLGDESFLADRGQKSFNIDLTGMELALQKKRIESLTKQINLQTKVYQQNITEANEKYLSDTHKLKEEIVVLNMKMAKDSTEFVMKNAELERKVNFLEMELKLSQDNRQKESIQWSQKMLEMVNQTTVDENIRLNILNERNALQKKNEQSQKQVETLTYHLEECKKQLHENKNIHKLIQNKENIFKSKYDAQTQQLESLKSQMINQTERYEMLLNEHQNVVKQKDSMEKNNAEMVTQLEVYQKQLYELVNSKSGL